VCVNVFVLLQCCSQSRATCQLPHAPTELSLQVPMAVFECKPLAF